MLKKIRNRSYGRVCVSITSIAACVALMACMACAAAETEAVNDMGGFMSLERLKLAGLVILQGVATVFSVLAIIWGVLAAFSKIMSRKEKHGLQEIVRSEEKVIAQKQDAEPEPADVQEGSEDDRQLTAVIMAAVSCCIESDSQLRQQFKNGFKVVSFKQINK